MATIQKSKTSMKLHEIKGRNRYCGPAAIAALTGCTTDEAAVVIRSVSRQESVKGVHTHHLMQALALFGVRYSHRETYCPASRLTLAQWLKKTDRPRGKVFLVVAGNHFQIVTGRQYTCGRLRAMVSVRDERVKRRSRVEEVFALSAGVITKPSALAWDEQKKKEARQIQAARPKAKKLAEAHGMRVEIDVLEYGNRHYYVYAKPETEAHQDYPFGGDHIVHDWREVLWRVEEIISFEASLQECDPLGVL